MINATEQLDLIETELKSTYRRLGFTNSNILEFIPDLQKHNSESQKLAELVLKFFPKFFGEKLSGYEFGNGVSADKDIKRIYKLAKQLKQK